MGYWTTDANGNSGVFEDIEGDLRWGDQPADIIDDALDQVLATFVHDLGRLPTQAEIVAGLKFSLPTLLERLPKTVAQAQAKADEVLAGWWEQPSAERDGYLTDPVSEEGKAFQNAYYAAKAPYDAERALAANAVYAVVNSLKEPEGEPGQANQDMRANLTLVEG